MSYRTHPQTSNKMRFTTLAFATGAIAQITVLTPVVDKIVADIGTLNTAIQGYTGGDGADVLAAGKKLLDDIKSGVTTAKGSSDLTQTDAVQLSAPFTSLQSATEGVIKGLASKKCNFVSSGKAAEVLSNLQDQMTTSKALAEAITSKVPTALQSVASSLSGGIATALQGGVDSFKDTSSCPAAQGEHSGSSAAPSSAAPSSAAPPSVAPSSDAPSYDAASYDAPSSAAPTSAFAPPSNGSSGMMSSFSQIAKLRLTNKQLPLLSRQRPPHPAVTLLSRPLLRQQCSLVLHLLPTRCPHMLASSLLLLFSALLSRHRLINFRMSVQYDVIIQSRSRRTCTSSGYGWSAKNN